jgi:hypothetical protein
MPRLRLARFAALMTLGLLACAAMANGATSKNLLENPGFEESLKGHPWMPAGWDTAASGLPSVFFGRDNSFAHSGNYSVNVANASTVLPLAYNWSQGVPIDPSMWGKDLVLTVWTKSVGVEGRAYVKLEAYCDTISRMAKTWNVSREDAASRLRITQINDPILDLGWKRQFFSQPETDWVRHELRVYVAPSVNMAFVRCGILGIGQLYVDDASLTVEPAQPAAEIQPNVNLIADPGFEGDGNSWELSLPPYPGMNADRDTTVAHSGKASMRFSSEHIGFVAGKTGVCQVFPNRNLAGKRVRLSGYMKCDSLKSSAYLTIYCHTVSGAKQKVGSEKQFSGTMPWGRAVVEMDVPPDTYEVWAWLAYTAPAAGVLYIDDASFEVVGPATGQP